MGYLAGMNRSMLIIKIRLILVPMRILIERRGGEDPGDEGHHFIPIPIQSNALLPLAQKDYQKGTLHQQSPSFPPIS